MAKYRKTYGMNGLLEWHGVIDSGGVKMRVSFTNGSTSAFGVAPASFTTEKEIVQHIIENSDLFKSGRIFIVMSSPIPGTEEPEKKVNKEEEGQATAAMTKVNVSSVVEARDYLVDNFGVSSGKLKSRAACIAAGEEHGIEFVWE